jgi:hypothetical protein
MTLANLGVILSAVMTAIAVITVAVITVRNWRAANRGDELPFTGYALAGVMWTLAAATMFRQSYEAGCYAVLLGASIAGNEWQRRHLE